MKPSLLVFTASLHAAHALCGLPACTTEVLNRQANAPDSSGTCMGRIEWVIANEYQGLDEPGACQLVGEEFPSICGPCAPYGLPDGVPPPPVPPSGPGLEVVTYNLYWWNVAQNNNWSSLWSKIQSQSFDLIGFQECDDIYFVLSNVDRMSSFQAYAPGWGQAIAWDSGRFEEVSDSAGVKYVATDRWGDRYAIWVRLRDRETGATIFAINTHGPVSGCAGSVEQMMLAAVTENIRDGDMLIYTGDFNCWSPLLDSNFQLVAPGGIDMIFTNKGRAAASWRSVGGSPSDHPLVRATFAASEPVADESTAEPTDQPSAEPAEPTLEPTDAPPTSLPTETETDQPSTDPTPLPVPTLEPTATAVEADPTVKPTIAPPASLEALKASIDELKSLIGDRCSA